MMPVISFIIALMLLIIIVMLNIDVTIAVGVSAIIYGILTKGPLGLFDSIINSLMDLNTFNLLVIFILALFLAGEMNEVGILNQAVEVFSSIGERFASYAIPALVGLIPMPGGALVSAIALENHYFNKLELKKPHASYLNYWFRHIWVPSWPIYQAIIVSSAILGVEVYKIISSTYPISLSAIISGLIISVPMLTKRKSKDKREISISRIFYALWPFMLIALLILALKVPVYLALIITLIPLMLYFRPNRSMIREGLKLALSPKIIAIVFLVMLYKDLILTSGAAENLFEILKKYNIPLLVLAFIVPFLIGVSTSGEFVYASTAFPLLLPILMPNGILNKEALMVAFMGGYLGIMMSPVHLCLILTTERYHIPIRPVYPYIIPSVVLTIIITLLLSQFLL